MSITCGWCWGRGGPCWCKRFCGNLPRPDLGLPGCPLRPGNTDWPEEAWPLGPLWTQIWRALPFLDELDPATLDGGPRWEAFVSRRVGQGRECLLCAERLASAALAVEPQFGADRRPRVADLCPACLSAVQDEGRKMIELGDE